MSIIVHCTVSRTQISVRTLCHAVSVECNSAQWRLASATGHSVSSCNTRLYNSTCDRIGWERSHFSGGTNRTRGDRSQSQFLKTRNLLPVLSCTCYAVRLLRSCARVSLLTRLCVALSSLGFLPLLASLWLQHDLVRLALNAIPLLTRPRVRRRSATRSALSACATAVSRLRLS